MLWSLQAPHAAVMVKPTPCLIDGCQSTSTDKHTQYIVYPRIPTAVLHAAQYQLPCWAGDTFAAGSPIAGPSPSLSPIPSIPPCAGSWLWVWLCACPPVHRRLG
ncbi:hypothetical protein CGCTS75_v006664 [Colletotrichum tropicale]|nr:hypothetical protein CGCTS75_v006664 [Colletotrichum tropicale]